jgi:hypothetical protein
MKKLWRKLLANRIEEGARAEAPEPQPLVSFDFKRYFPHKFWVSNWKKDEEYPAGFRYKLLSVRDEQENRIELVTVMEEPGEIKTERDRSTIAPPEAFERLVPGYVAKLEETFGIEFALTDVSDIRDEENWKSVSEDEGFRPWKERPPQ